MNEEELRKDIENLVLNVSVSTGLSESQIHDVTEYLISFIRTEVLKAEKRGMEKSRSRVLRRTEIPADAKKPTRDVVVVIGEECARIIQQDIDSLEAQLQANQEEKKT